MQRFLKNYARTSDWILDREREKKSTVVLRANIKQKVQISFTQIDIKKV